MSSKRPKDTEFPPFIEAHIRNRVIAESRPFCFEFDRALKLIRCFGDGAHYGLGELIAGQDMSAVAPFIAHCDPGASTLLPLVTDPAGNHLHVHILPTGETLWAIYLDAGKEFRQRRAAQQKANEARLLSETQHKLIGELVDARAELERRRLEAEEDGRRKSAYIATMSHDFRTPLAAMLGYAELLAEQSVTADKRRHWALAIRRAIEGQLGLIDNLLKQARPDAEGLEINETVVDLRHVIDDISVVIAPLAAEKGLGFAAYVAADIARYVRLDDMHLRQILINVAGNAVKFTEAGAIALGVALTDGRLVFETADSGRGISDDERDRVFHAFERGSAGGRRPGAGLGLAISKRLAEAMGGSLALESAPQVGTTVRLRLPYLPVAHDLPSQPGGDTPARPDDSVTVLLVEDDLDIQELLQFTLARAGYRVISTSDGIQAIDTALSVSPDLIVMDINLKGQNGPIAASELRERGFDAPILGLSASDSACVRAHALASGFTDFIRKPATVPRLLRRIEKLLLTRNLHETAR